jgi:hypothetical protein
MLTMVTLDGMLPTKQAPDSILCRQFAKLLWLTLSLNVCLNKSTKTETVLCELEHKLKKYQELYRSLVGPQREMMSKTGMRIVKFHCMSHFPKQYGEFGSAFNYFGGFFEACIKTMVIFLKQRTTKKHSRFVEDLMTRYYEQQVCAVSTLSLDTTQKTNENSSNKHVPNSILRPTQYMSNSGFTIVLDIPTKKWIITGKKMNTSKALFQPLSNNPSENHWIEVIAKYLKEENIFEAKVGFQLKIRGKIKSVTSNIFRCHPNLYPENSQPCPWYDFAKCSISHGWRRLRLLPCMITRVF